MFESSLFKALGGRIPMAQSPPYGSLLRAGTAAGGDPRG